MYIYNYNISKHKGIGLGASGAVPLSLFHPWKFSPGIVGAGSGIGDGIVVISSVFEYNLTAH